MISGRWPPDRLPPAAASRRASRRPPPVTRRGHGSIKEAADILSLPGNVRQGVLIPTAYYTGETFRPAPRRPVQEVMHLNHW